MIRSINAFYFLSCFILVITCSLLTVLPAFCATETAPESQPGFTETTTLIAEIPENATIIADSIQPLPRFGKMAYAYEDENGFKVCMNNQCGPYVDRVAKETPIFSPDGKHWAAIVQTGGRARVMLNGTLGRAFDLVHGLSFSPDSSKLAYAARQGEEYFVYVNQDRHQAFSFIDLRQGLIFSPDSRQLAYLASTDGRTWHLVKNGEPGPAFDEIKHVTFSNDSSRLVYAARNGKTWRLVEGDRKSDGYLEIQRVRFSPLNQLAYAARVEEGEYVVMGTEKSRVFDHVVGNLVFSFDGKRMAYIIAEQQKSGKLQMRMVVDGEIGPPFDQIGAYYFSADGGHFAYMANKDGKGMIVHNGVAQKAYDSVGLPVFAAGGRHLAYMAFKEGHWLVVKDGKEGSPFDTVQSPVFCPRGERMVYMALLLGSSIVVENQEDLRAHLFANLVTFSPDGEHLAYVAADESGESFLVIDYQIGAEKFFSFLKGPPLVFTSRNTVQGIAVRDEGRSFWLIRADIK